MDAPSLIRMYREKYPDQTKGMDDAQLAKTIVRQQPQYRGLFVRPGISGAPPAQGMQTQPVPASSAGVAQLASALPMMGAMAAGVPATALASRLPQGGMMGLARTLAPTAARMTGAYAGGRAEEAVTGQKEPDIMGVPMSVLGQGAAELVNPLAKLATSIPALRRLEDQAVGKLMGGIKQVVPPWRGYGNTHAGMDDLLTSSGRTRLGDWVGREMRPAIGALKGQTVTVTPEEASMLKLGSQATPLTPRTTASVTQSTQKGARKGISQTETATGTEALPKDPQSYPYTHIRRTKGASAGRSQSTSQGQRVTQTMSTPVSDVTVPADEALRHAIENRFSMSTNTEKRELYHNLINQVEPILQRVDPAVAARFAGARATYAEGMGFIDSMEALDVMDKGRFRLDRLQKNAADPEKAVMDRVATIERAPVTHKLLSDARETVNRTPGTRRQIERLRPDAHVWGPTGGPLKTSALGKLIPPVATNVPRGLGAEYGIPGVTSGLADVLAHVPPRSLVEGRRGKQETNQ